MNDLYLIGNGFDLAHGLETSYEDFLLWYLKRSVSNINHERPYEDELISIYTRYTRHFDAHESILTLLENFQKLNVTIKYKHDFFKNIVESYRDFKWVNIEYDYYLALLEIYKWYEKLNIINGNLYNKEIVSLNACFDFLKKKLVEYLIDVEITSKKVNRQIESILLEGTGVKGNDKGEKLFINFNYTKTLEFYTKRNFPTKNNLVNIHGELENPTNPIIFGYGDEMDPHYEKIENLNNNEFLRNIKSFGYFRTNNYQRVNSFIEGDGKEFTVKILGHSCGLSDRILLNTIFEHPNCKAIKIYYYQKSETENDYFEKTQEISRHFKASGKGNMRAKIVSFDESVPLLPFDTKN